MAKKTQTKSHEASRMLSALGKDVPSRAATRFRVTGALPLPFGRYTLIRRVAAGGMAEVYVGIQEGLASFMKLSALKCLHSHLADNERFVEMFLDEGKLAAALSHANIVNTYDLGQCDGIYFMAMEYVHGQSLAHVLAKDKDPPFAAAMNVALDATEGLAFAHQAVDQHGDPLSIVHRDISPKNILVSYGGEVKLADFGIARAAQQNYVTLSGEIKGTPSYMPLEQLETRDVDARIDVYAMGVTLFELFTGERLFYSPGMLHKDLFDAAKRKVPPPSSKKSELPKSLDKVILKATAVKASNRFEDGGELHEALNAVAMEIGVEKSKKVVSSWMKKVFPKESALPPLTKEEHGLVKMAQSMEVPLPLQEEIEGLSAVMEVSPGDQTDLVEQHQALAKTATEIPGTVNDPIATTISQSQGELLGASEVSRRTAKRKKVYWGISAAAVAVLSIGAFFLVPPFGNDGRIALSTGSDATRPVHETKADAKIEPDAKITLKDSEPKQPKKLDAKLGDLSAKIQTNPKKKDAGKKKVVTPVSPVKTVRIKVTSAPYGASIFLDGVSKGKTPTSFKIPAQKGKFGRLVIDKKGFRKRVMRIRLDRNLTVGKPLISEDFDP